MAYLLCGSRIGEFSADFVDHFLPNLVFQDFNLACCTKGPGFQNLGLLFKEAGEFASQFFTRPFSMVPPLAKRHVVDRTSRRRATFQNTA